MILRQRLELWTANVEFHRNGTAKQIDYEISMEKIKQYRMSIYSNNTKYRWLFLTNFRTYNILMDRHYFAQYYAALRHPNIEPVLWGRDFPEYDTSKTIIENIRNRFGSNNYFDVIYQSGGIYHTKDVRLASQHSPIMMREHECWGYRCLPSIIDENVTILLQTFAYEMDLYHTSFSYNRVLAHSPACAEPLVYYPPAALKSDEPPERDIDLLIVGPRYNIFYPLQKRITRLVEKGVIEKSHIYAHPGYAFENKNVTYTESQMDEYAKLLRRAKVAIVDSARYGHASSKYTEFALSGVLVIGDIPSEREDEYRQYVVEISTTMMDQQILSIIEYWIKNDDEREKRVAIGQQIALNAYTWDHSIDIALRALIKYKRQEYGIYHNYPYSTHCAPMDNTLNRRAVTTKWCPSGIRGIPLRSPCECDRTRINYLEEELDLDNWNSLGVNVDSTNPGKYLVPTTFILYCDEEKSIRTFASEEQSGSACRCKHADGSWRGFETCYISNSALAISRYFAYVYAHSKSVIKN